MDQSSYIPPFHNPPMLLLYNNPLTVIFVTVAILNRAFPQLPS